MTSGREGIGELVSRVGSALGEEAELHVELVKAELARDARAVARDLVPVVAGGGLLLLGYGFANLAGGLALAPWIGAAWGFVVVSVVNLLVGAVAVRVGLARLGARSIAESSATAELELSAHELVAAVRPPRDAGEVPDGR